MTENDLQRGKELKAELEEYKSIRSKIKFQKIDRNVAIDKAKKTSPMSITTPETCSTWLASATSLTSRMM